MQDEITINLGFWHQIAAIALMALVAWYGIAAVAVRYTGAFLADGHRAESNPKNIFWHWLCSPAILVGFLLVIIIAGIAAVIGSIVSWPAKTFTTYVLGGDPSRW